jgi:glucokinase
VTDAVGLPTFGLDVGGTNVRCGVVDHDGTVLEELRAPTPDDDHALIAQMTDLVRRLGARFPSASAVGVGVAALVDRDGWVQFAPNIPGLRRVPLRSALQEQLGLPVVVDNDANAAAWGEVVHGAARGTLYSLVITLGTGIGGGIVARGRIIRGEHGFAAEVGHFQIEPNGLLCACGERGHWEAYASGSALGRMGREWAAAGRAPSVLARAGGDADAVTGVMVGDAAQAGDDDGKALLAEYVDYVAIGLAGLANILDPERIVISGGLVELGDTLFVPLRLAFANRVEGADYRPEIAIVPAELGEQAGVIGAAARARDLEPGSSGVWVR